MGRQRADVVVGSVSGGSGKAYGDGWVYLKTKDAEGQATVSFDPWVIVGWS